MADQEITVSEGLINHADENVAFPRLIIVEGDSAFHTVVKYAEGRFGVTTFGYVERHSADLTAMCVERRYSLIYLASDPDFLGVLRRVVRHLGLRFYTLEDYNDWAVQQVDFDNEQAVYITGVASLTQEELLYHLLNHSVILTGLLRDLDTANHRISYTASDLRQRNNGFDLFDYQPVQSINMTTYIERILLPAAYMNCLSCFCNAMDGMRSGERKAMFVMTRKLKNVPSTITRILKEAEKSGYYLPLEALKETIFDLERSDMPLKQIEAVSRKATDSRYWVYKATRVFMACFVPQLSLLEYRTRNGAELAEPYYYCPIIPTLLCTKFNFPIQFVIDLIRCKIDETPFPNLANMEFAATVVKPDGVLHRFLQLSHYLNYWFINTLAFFEKLFEYDRLETLEEWARKLCVLEIVIDEEIALSAAQLQIVEDLFSLFD